MKGSLFCHLRGLRFFVIDRLIDNRTRWPYVPCFRCLVCRCGSVSTSGSLRSPFSRKAVLTFSVMVPMFLAIVLCMCFLPPSGYPLISNIVKIICFASLSFGGGWVSVSVLLLSELYNGVVWTGLSSLSGNASLGAQMEMTLSPTISARPILISGLPLMGVPFVFGLLGLWLLCLAPYPNLVLGSAGLVRYLGQYSTSMGFAIKSTLLTMTPRTGDASTLRN